MPKARRQLTESEKGRALERIRAGQPVALAANAYGMSSRTLRDAVGAEAYDAAIAHARMMRAQARPKCDSTPWNGRFNMQANASTRTWK